MADQLHPVAIEHLPSFITAPGETDGLMVFLAFFLAFSVFAFGVFYWRLHSLPERIAHKSQKIQFEFVAILGLISLFTHNHIFWIAGLLLAFIDIPNFSGFLGRIAGSLERMAGLKPGAGADGVPEPSFAASSHALEEAPKSSDDSSEPSAANKPLHAVAGGKEADHA
jgi:hypothetical protein